MAVVPEQVESWQRSGYQLTHVSSISPLCLLAQERVHLGAAKGGVDIAKRAVFPHLFRGAQQSGHRRAIERSRQADALHSGRRESRDGKRLALDSGHEVERLAD